MQGLTSDGLGLEGNIRFVAKDGLWLKVFSGYFEPECPGMFRNPFLVSEVSIERY